MIGDRKLDIGLDTRPEPTRLTAGDIAAGVGAAVWLVIAGGIILFVPGGDDGPDGLRLVTAMTVMALPVALLGMVAAVNRSARIHQEENAALRDTVETLRNAWMTEREGRESREKVVPKQFARPAPEVAVTFATRREAPGAVPEAVTAAVIDDQPSLALGTPAEDLQAPLPHADLIRALNFPDHDKDEAGFAALRLALRDRQARLLVRASQDILTLLSQEGIYMDDMHPDRAKPEVWRRFAKGERGRTVAALGGIRDRSSLALTSGRMRQDAIFRDAAHHFLRRFDQLLVTFEETATDEELVQLAETRTARAFMLLGRVTGAFD